MEKSNTADHEARIKAQQDEFLRIDKIPIKSNKFIKLPPIERESMVTSCIEAIREILPYIEDQKFTMVTLRKYFIDEHQRGFGSRQPMVRALMILHKNGEIIRVSVKPHTYQACREQKK